MKRMRHYGFVITSADQPTPAYGRKVKKMAARFDPQLLYFHVIHNRSLSASCVDCLSNMLVWP